MIRKIDKKKWYSFKLFLYVLPFIVLVLLFSYYPLYGWLYAFYDYRPPRPFSEAEFVGLKWFKSLVENPVKVAQLWQVLKNTFVMSGITLGTSWLPMIFAVFLNEIRCVPFRKFVQTVTTLPNFISWVLVYSVAFSLFNSTGMMNTLLMNLGIIKEPVLFLQSADNVCCGLLGKIWGGRQLCILRQSPALMTSCFRQRRWMAPRGCSQSVT